MTHIEVPQRALTHLLTGFVCHEGEELARTYASGQLAHPGDPFGTVFAWLWETDRTRAVMLVADLLAEARGNAASDDKKLTFDALLKDLRFALHNTPLSHWTEYEKVEAHLRREVPRYFGDAPLH